MVTAATARTGQDEQTLVVDLPFPGEADQAPFSRADILISGADHSSGSYEVRLFLNNATATAATPRTAEEGYAGRYTIFGHGNCYGDDGHCDVPVPSTDPTDFRPAHPLTPLDTYVTVTEALRRVLSDGGDLQTVTLVPISVTPRRADRHPALDLLHFDDISLHTYLTATEAEPEAG